MDSSDLTYIGTDVTEGNSGSDLLTYIFPDFNAVKYFQRDFILHDEFHVLEESTATGFDIYLVEQWANTRNIGTVVSNFTGNMGTKISVVKLTIIKKPVKHYPPRFQDYLNELFSNHAKVKKMERELSDLPHNGSLGENSNQVLFVTNITALPSNLNLIPIPNGDYRDVEMPFVINFNLKKLQCTGRSLSLISERIADVNEDKFRHQYRIFNPKIPLVFAVRELISIIQTCLFYFDLLDAKYCDGLLCFKTEEAIMNWWNLIGLPHFNFKPNFKYGMLQPKTVTAILSLILSSKLRLQIIGGCEVPKDPFDYESFMLSVGQFQKQYKLEKTRKLDLETLNKLFLITNAKLSPEGKNANGEQLYKGQEYDDPQAVDSLYSRATGSSYTNLANLGSPYKRNKNYYSKELKKLTNVVKNTVQDHINAANLEAEEGSSNPKSGSARLRNTIAKLADNLSPLDVETLDLDVLVRNYLTGKTLITLWYGTHSTFSGAFKDASKKHQHRHHHHHHHTYSHGQYSSNQYQFESLRDKVSNNKDLSSSLLPVSDLSRYSRGINKMKLQSKKLLLSNSSKKNDQTDSPTVSSEARLNKRYTDRLEAAPSIDAALPIHAKKLFGDEKKGGQDWNTLYDQLTNDDPLTRFNKTINRRNSFPVMFGEQENNLNLIEYAHSSQSITFDELGYPFNLKLERSSSFSAIEDDINRFEGLSSIDRLSQKYLHVINLLVTANNFRTYLDDTRDELLLTNRKMEKIYNQLNLDLLRLNNFHNQVMGKKVNVMDENLSKDLQFNIDDLTKTIDRLAYETRIVVKRVNELEQNSTVFNIKLNDQCLTKLEQIINNLIRLTKFHQVFADEDEKKEIIFKLTEKDPNEILSDLTIQESSRNIFQVIVIFLYNLIEYIFRFFKFDKSKMNLNRIRNTWIKLDPNRTIINRAYSMVGREPSRGSVARAKDEPLSE
ncbi:uncharacterized protein PRCAT00000982001 [Priceomyces carsonii]|uniref:uncharacterized protein n=1 Tax=Priceomyces carsonii TaxID=28549 RepID=UPI002ED96130|nr:unnamed protein product [Priceomyces carsonii]